MIFSKFIINIIYLIMLFQDNKIVKERVYEIYYDKIKSLSYLESKIKNISNLKKREKERIIYEKKR